MKTATDLILDILRKTSDGDTLKLSDLRFIEAAVNKKLNAEGKKKLERLHKLVMDGEYEEKWFHGIEHLTIKSSGYVFWKEKEVEHYSPSFADSERGKEAALELAEQCRRLESKGIEVNINSVLRGSDRSKS